MNCFEIKALMVALPEQNIVNMHYIDQEYNENVFGGREIDLIIEYKYKDIVFLKDVVFGSGYEIMDVEKETPELKIEKIRESLQSEMKKLKSCINEDINEKKDIRTFGFFVNMQADLCAIKDGRKRLKNIFYGDNRPLKIRSKNNFKPITNIQLYKESIKIAKKESKNYERV